MTVTKRRHTAPPIAFDASPESPPPFDDEADFRRVTTDLSSSIVRSDRHISSSTTTTTITTKDNQSLSPQMKIMLPSLIAGVGSGGLASIVCAPLDLVRTRMQVLGDMSSASSPTAKMHLMKAFKDIIHQDGIKGCFRGLSPTLATVPSFWGIYFPLYETLKRDLYQYYCYRDSHTIPETYTSRERVPPIIHMSSAIMAGSIADFFCNPMFVIRTRMQTEALHYYYENTPNKIASSQTQNQTIYKQHNMIQTAKHLYKESGNNFVIFWRGFTASLLGLSHVAVQFPVYEFLKAEARNYRSDHVEQTIDLFFASAISKMIATSLTYPHEVVRSRMMDYRGNDKSGKKLIPTVRRIVEKEGVKALYSGIHVSMIRVVPNCCITFMTYETIFRWVKNEFQ